MLHPNSGVSMAKDTVSILLLIWDALTLPFVLAWDPVPTLGFRVISMLVSVFWTLEMGLSARRHRTCHSPRTAEEPRR